MSVHDPRASTTDEEQVESGESERRMRLAAKAAHLGIYEWHIPSDRAIWENERIYEIFGRKPSEGPLSNAEFLAEYLHPDDQAPFRQAMADALEQGSPFHFICRIRHGATGDQRWVEFNGELEVSPSGEPLRLIGVIQDITERHRLENDRDRFLELGSDLQVTTRMDGHFQWVNPAFERLLGWSALEMTDRPWTFFVHPDDVNASQQETAGLFSGKHTHAFKNRYRHKDGHYLWLQWNARTYSSEQLIYGVAHDITAQVTAENDQRLMIAITDDLSRLSDPPAIMGTVGQRLLAHLGISRCVFVEYDLAHRVAHLVHDSCATGMRSMVGVYQMESLADLATLEILDQGRQLIIDDLASDPHTADRIEVFRSLGIGASLTSPYMSDGRVKFGISIHHREAHRWQENEIKLLKAISDRVWSSIERSRMEQRLRHSRDRLRLVTDSLPVLVSYLDRDHHYRFVNRRYTEWFGIEREDIEGRHLKDIVGEEVYALTVPKIERVFQGEELHFEQLHHYKKVGSRHVEVSFVPDRSEDGQVHGWYALVQDISERKANEEERKLADRRKDEFLATLSHELRNPLSPLKSALEILQMPVTKEEAKQATEIMERQVDRMTHLIDDLMDISRITRNKIDLQKRVIDLCTVVREAVEAADPLLKAEDHGLSIALPDRKVEVFADEDRMVQVLTNLLTNASKFTDRGGAIAIHMTAEDGKASISVKDNGIGIAEDQIAHIFEMFAQVPGKDDRHRTGLGIGLNLVKNLIEMHDGEVVVRSEGLGKGTEFVITLPLADPEHPH